MLSDLVREVHQMTGFSSYHTSDIEFKLAVNGDLKALRKSYCIRVKAFKCVQDSEAKERAVLTIKNLKASD